MGAGVVERERETELTHVSTLCQHMKRDQHLSSKASRPKKSISLALADAAYHVVHLMIKQQEISPFGRYLVQH